MPEIRCAAAEFHSLPQGDASKPFTWNALQDLRKKLLDLSGRNALLHYRHPVAASVRLVDELPDQVYAELSRLKSLSLAPVPEPTEAELIAAGCIAIDPETGEKAELEYPKAEQWAKHLGIATSYELPDVASVEPGQPQHGDDQLQTLLYSAGLDARLRSIRSRAQTALDESGAHILFLGIGFLEWFESGQSADKRLAPLFTVPVSLERSAPRGVQGAYRYRLSLRDDALLTNVTLREKLAHDFGLALPAVDEGMQPEAYFAAVERCLLPHQPRWRIRRQATLMLLNFSKQAMYEDLNPDNWPADEAIDQHPLVARFFTATEGQSGGTGGYDEEYRIDELEQVHENYPLIYDADSSQHSALVDAVRGTDLVIEGPPGSGKSQTITNLIAACMARGQRVLFVAEKMAALNVVKDRLDKAGLGELCLELHSHKTSRQQLLDDLGRSLTWRSGVRPPGGIQGDIERYEELRGTLQAYVDLTSKDWMATGLSLHQILNAATRYREETGIDPATMTIGDVKGESFTALRRKVLIDDARMLADIYQQVARQAPAEEIANHYWYGVNAPDLMGFQVNALQAGLRDWTTALEELDALWRRQAANLGLPQSDAPALSELRALASAVDRLPASCEQIHFSLLPQLLGSTGEFEALIEGYQAIHDEHHHLLTGLSAAAIDAPENVNVLEEACQRYVDLGAPSAVTLRRLAGYLNQAGNTLATLETLQAPLAQFREHLPAPWGDCLGNNLSGLREALKLSRLVSALPADLWRYRDHRFDDADLDPLLERTAPLVGVLKPLHDKLAPVFDLNALPDSQALVALHAVVSKGGTFRWLSASWRDARKRLIALATAIQPDKAAVLATIPELIRYAEAWQELELLHRRDPGLGDFYQGVHTPVGRLMALRYWYGAVRREYGYSFGQRVALGDALLTLDRQLALSIADVADRGLTEQLEQCLQHWRELAEGFPAALELRESDGDNPAPALTRLRDGLQANAALLQPMLPDGGLSLAQLRNLVDRLGAQHRRIAQWRQTPAAEQWVGTALTLDAEPGTYSRAALGACRDTLAAARVLATSPALQAAIQHSPSEGRYGAIMALQPELGAQLVRCDAKAASFSVQGEVDIPRWIESSAGVPGELIARNRVALAHPQWLNTWLDYVRVRNRIAGRGLSKISDGLAARQFPPEAIEEVVKAVVFHQLAREALAVNPGLAQFSGMAQMAVRERFAHYDRRLLELQRQRVAYDASRQSAPSGVATGRVGDYSEMGLIRHNLGLKKPRIAVRSLLRRAGQTVQALKPCFMMSPMSVAQYLEPGKFKFDLVVMDEASQIRPEDALGAIARGKHLVVVGDPKQLPPTSFFQKVVDNDGDEDLVALQTTESILETVMPMFRTRRLRWHYRSRHESLIAFSNRNFYNSDLVLFPSPFQHSDEFGIRFHPVEQGRFHARRNPEEARQLVEAVGRQLIERPGESVGVVAMNADQADEIERQLEQRVRDDPMLQAALAGNQALDEPLFIKNLENVQGDERDVIVISMTYGPPIAGASAMPQRFGPINQDVGWRRLNVLFTRAKKRMHVHSSMSSGHVVVSKQSSRGVEALRSFLQYCETGQVPVERPTGKPADSDFEIAVMRRLQQHGYECEPQLGVAGYFLDLAVRDPGQPGRFLMGIECDGATYHSAKSVRDRDRLRQDVLEGLGWCIRRIWSTDWFKHPDAQLQPILQELERMRTPHAPQPAEAEITRAPAPKDPVSDGADPDPEALDADVDLRARLLDFDRRVIRPGLPATPADARLLRPALLDRLLFHAPCSRAEFFEVIPAYLREATAAREGEFLERVLELIDRYG